MNPKSITFEDPLLLESGDQLQAPTVSYSTYGALNEDKDNVIVVCHALTANSNVHDWWAGLFGEGKVYDPSVYFIICANNLGSPYGTSSPKSIDPNSEERYGMDFPFYTIRDTADLQLRLLEHLGIEHIHLLIGGSCGGNIAQEMAINLGEKIDNLVFMCCSAQETPWVISIHESQRIVLKGDPSLSNNSASAGKEGLRGARAFALPFYRSHPSFKIRQSEGDNEKINDFKAASYIRYQGQKFVDRYDAHSYYKQLIALDTHNIARGRIDMKSALALISARTLCIGFSTDLLIPVVEQQILAEHIPNAKYAEIETEFGHDAFLIEIDELQRIIGDFLR
ncbi:MAG: homoserine O-acetyltransferase [Saprospiraceae bacterium]|jgi:homoserine O-acetyltransferase